MEELIDPLYLHLLCFIQQDVPLRATRFLDFHPGDDSDQKHPLMYCLSKWIHFGLF